MRQWNKMQLLVYAAEILLLAAVLIFVVRFVPDFGKDKEAQNPISSEESSVGSGESGAEPSRAETTEQPEDGGDGRGTEESAGLPGGEEGSGGKKNRKKGSRETSDEGTGEEAEYRPPTLMVASDLHYQSPKMTDFLGSFDNFTAWSDGTVVPYLDPIAEAFLEEAVMQRPDVLILSGDISQNGEKVNHQELAKKLRRVQEAGVPVLVIPGNHDINHPWSASYFGDKTEPAEGTTAEDFYEIYHEFGYDQASSRDEESLSYLYKLDERYWLMMLDSCIYEPVQETGGRIKPSTLEWMRGQLDAARDEGVTVIPVAHHNLLDESTLYREECTLENGKEVTALLEEYGLPVYISGHMHLQRIKKHEESPLTEGQYGIYEIVSSSLSIPPCQYGIINWEEDGSFHYRTRQVDVKGWAERYREEDPNFLNFDAYAAQFLVDVVAEQAFKNLEAVPEEQKREMAELFGRLNSAYCAGKKISTAEVKKTPAYLRWSRYQGASRWYDRLTSILRDTKRDHNRLSLKAGIDFPAAAGGRTERGAGGGQGTEPEEQKE